MGPEPAPQALAFRFLQTEDIPALYALWRAAELPIRTAGREHPDHLRVEFESYPRNFIGAFHNDQLVGAVIASWDGRRAWINRLAVHPEFRRRGIGRQLIDRAETELRNRGAQVLAALIEPDNQASLSLFSTSGYKPTPPALYLSKRNSLDV